MHWNLPNKLTMIRILGIPAFIVLVVFPIFPADWLWRVVSCVVFIVIAATDFLDGQIARKRNLVTNFGKFLDPLADKMLIFGALLALTMRTNADAVYFEDEIFAWVWVCASFIVIFREMAVTSLRLVASNATGVVIAAAWAGKLKTVTQMVCVCAVLLEPIVWKEFGFNTHYILSYVLIGAMVILTIYSGVQYFIAYWPCLKEE